MATKIETLKKPNGDQVLPRTRAKAVSMEDGTSVEAAIVDIKEDVNQLSSEKVDKNQGSVNVGKILVVGADGNVTLANMPVEASGDVIGLIDENNNIVITGDLADGTYVFKYENTDGTYAEIGSLVVGGVVQYSITTTLTECMAVSGNATVINEGGTVTLKYTAKDGFILNNTISVNGASYTWDATTGTLVLSDPTADVTITVTATKNGYTNIIDTVGYKDGIRLSTSDGVSERDATGYTTTGMLEVPIGGVVRTRGVNFNSDTYSTALIHRYNPSTGAYVTSYKTTNTGIADMPIELDANGNVTITCEYATNIRLTGYGSGANLIVTINEEITD